MISNEIATVLMNESVWNNFATTIVLFIVIVGVLFLIYKIQDLTKRFEELDRYVRYLDQCEQYEHEKENQ